MQTRATRTQGARRIQKASTNLLKGEVFMTEKKPLPRCTPEQAGIPSDAIARYLRTLSEGRLALHDVLIARGGRLCFEAYWKPFDPAFRHRLYSCSKSFVSVAVGMLIERGQLALSDRCVDFFPDKAPREMSPYLREMTIRDLLMMATCYQNGASYLPTDPDWEATFFTSPVTHKAGQVFSYCTTATTMLCMIIRRVSGKEFMGVLRPVFDEIGISEEAFCVETPCGHEWGGSGVCLTAHEFLKFACLMTSYGRYEGRQLLSEGYLREATRSQIDNGTDHDTPDTETGYGYQFWPMRNGGFAMRGMGGQFALCLPDKQLTVITNGYDELSSTERVQIFDSYWRDLVASLSDAPLPEDAKALQSLNAFAQTLELPCPLGEKHADIERSVGGRTYAMDENPLGITALRFDFAGDGGTLSYANATGRHELRFALGGQLETVFPETHYYGRRIGVPSGKPYHAFVSAAWPNGHQLRIDCHVVDVHLANLRMVFSFDGDTVTLLSRKHAEWFMDEYQGFASGRAVD